MNRDDVIRANCPRFGPTPCYRTFDVGDVLYLLDEKSRLTADLAAMTADRDALKADVAAAEARCGRLGRLLDERE